MKILILFTVLFFLSSFSSAKFTIFNDFDAKKSITDLNLFPTKSANIINSFDVYSHGGPRIVEKRFKFPNFFDPNGASIEELGHHAGYYQIENSHDARALDQGKEKWLQQQTHRKLSKWSKRWLAFRPPLLMRLRLSWKFRSSLGGLEAASHKLSQNLAIANLHMEGEEDKLEGAVVALQGDALIWFQWEHRRKPLHRWEELKGVLLKQF
ncbi:Serine carboxypeptidase-like 49 [Bienertia sinuspersici]